MDETPSRQATPSQTVGPFFSFGLTAMAWSDLVPPGSTGALALTGRVLDGDGTPLPDAMVEVWADLPDGGRFGRSLTAEDGGFAFTVAKPPVPDAGRSLASGTQAPHLDVAVFARGLLKRVVTRMYYPDETAANAADPLLDRVLPGRRSTLLAERTGEGRLRFDIHLQGEQETVFLGW
ncbi:MAG: protocatechuate 3,4-dioxygenase subunit alpha [Acidimicrobiales bacterium]